LGSKLRDQALEGIYSGYHGKFHEIPTLVADLFIYKIKTYIYIVYSIYSYDFHKIKKETGTLFEQGKKPGLNSNYCNIYKCVCVCKAMLESHKYVKISSQIFSQFSKLGKIL